MIADKFLLEVLKESGGFALEVGKDAAVGLASEFVRREFHKHPLHGLHLHHDPKPETPDEGGLTQLHLVSPRPAASTTGSSTPKAA